MPPLLAVVSIALVTFVSLTTVYTWTSVFAEDTDEPPLPRANAEARQVDGEKSWIDVLLRGDRVVAIDDLDVRVQAPDREGPAPVCRSPGLTQDGGCEDPLDPEHTFSGNQVVWVPCKGPGSNVLTLHVEGNRVLETEVVCSASPAAR